MERANLCFDSVGAKITLRRARWMLRQRSIIDNSIIRRPASRSKQGQATYLPNSVSAPIDLTLPEEISDTFYYESVSNDASLLLLFAGLASQAGVVIKILDTKHEWTRREYTFS